MLLRNFNPTAGHCYGTRYVIEGMMDKCLKLRGLTGKAKGETLYLPRIYCTPSDKKNHPFTLRRRQFPIKVAFSMSINKAQGQTLAKVGLYLKHQIFGHGQLYVGASRVGSFEQLRFCVKKNKEFDHPTTKNVVYTEILGKVDAVIDNVDKYDPDKIIKIGDDDYILELLEENSNAFFKAAKSF